MALDLGELSVRLSAEDQLTSALNGAQQSARRTEQVTSQAATGITASTQRMAQGYQQLQREATTYATASERANSRAETATEAVRVAQGRLDAAQRDSTTSADQLEAAQRGVATATGNAERAIRQAEQANDRMEASHRRAARAAEQGGRDAVTAMERAQRAMRETAQEAERSGEAAGSGFADRFSGGLEGLSGTAGSAGSSTGGSFIAGFAPRVAGLGSKGGPIGVALAGVAVLGIGVGVALADAIADGMQQEATQDLIQAKLGINEETARRIGEAAGAAYSNGWGESAASNMDGVRAAIQSGLLTGEEDTGTFKSTIEQLNIVSEIMGEEIPAVARAAGQSVKNGIAKDATGAFDLLVQSQKNSLNVSEDLLDSQIEYSTQLRALGLEGAEGWALVAQGVKGGARDTDVVIDALKEMKLRATDGTAAAADGFEKLSLNSELWTTAMNEGGEASRNAMADALRGLNAITDPTEKNAAALALFGTKFEDIQGAAFKLNLDTAVTEFGDVAGAAALAGDTMSSNTEAAFTAAKNSIEMSSADIKLALAQAFGPALTDLAVWVKDNKPEIIGFFTGLADAGFTTLDAILAFTSGSLRFLADWGEVVGATMGNALQAMGSYAEFMGGIVKHIPGMQDVGEAIEGAGEKTKWYADQVQSSSDKMNGLADMIDNARPGIREMGDDVRAAGERAEASARLMDALSGAVYKVPDDKSIVITSNTPQHIEDLEALGMKVERLPDGTFKVTSNTDEGQAAIDAFIGNNTGKNIDMFVDLRQRQIGYWRSQGVSEADAPSMQGPTPYLNAGGGAPAAPGTLGGGGGNFADGKLPQEALIKSAGGKGLVQWAEEGAGPWEAFIPGAESKRPRAVGILKDVADRFGYGLVQMADGGIVSGLSNLASENFPALTMTSGYRAGDPGHHGSGQAADFSNGSDNTPEQLAFANFMVDNYKPKLLELIYSAPGFDKNVKNGSIVDGSFYGASTMAGHRNHVHVAMSQPPGEPSSDPGSYDVGAQALTVTDYGQPDSSSAGMSSGSRTKTLPTSSGPVDVRVINFSDIGGAAPDGRTPKAVGSLKVFANGGIESQNPEIATTGGNVRVWAEPQAGPWEAYIPGDPAKRARAVDIWRETGKRLNITEFADGGFGGYNEPKARDYMRPTNLMEAASLAAGLGFTAASGVGGFLSMAQSGQVDLSQLMPQFDTGSNDIPGLSEAVIGRLDQLVEILSKGGLVTLDANFDTSNGSVALDLLSTGIA
ncbi:hypothetical protein [Rhodococcus cercidiphylli]|uniref:Tape measure protein n=1 Tax=Rhodococcus cercidiphylli TaxID=489916 RepID=A0ABU4B0G1_9NOCA|nr:hypothetical protein [Rhodococcus cercidiphylli]MDV6231931.1 hypothetical protein [Rhodococcus cercidiphylli]